MIIKFKRVNVNYKIRFTNLNDLKNKLIFSNFINESTAPDENEIIKALEKNGFNKIEFII